PRRALEPVDRERLGGRPVHETTSCRLLGPPAEHGRGRADGGANEEAALPQRVAEPDPPRRPARAAHARTSSSTASTSANASPNSRLATARNASTSPVVSWRWIAGAGRVPASRAWPLPAASDPEACPASEPDPGASSPLIDSSSTSADAVAVALST